MTDEPITGGCLCGGVRFELSEAPVDASYCHCTRCQRRTGTSSSAQARVAPGSFRLLAGEGLVKGWQHPDGGAEKCFCANCGAHLFSRNAETHAVGGVRMSAFDHDIGIRPTHRNFTAYAAAWEPIPDDGLPRYPERRPS